MSAVGCISSLFSRNGVPDSRDRVPGSSPRLADPPARSRRPAHITKSIVADITIMVGWFRARPVPMASQQKEAGSLHEYMWTESYQVTQLHEHIKAVDAGVRFERAARATHLLGEAAGTISDTRRACDEMPTADVVQVKTGISSKDQGDVPPFFLHGPSSASRDGVCPLPCSNLERWTGFLCKDQNSAPSAHTEAEETPSPFARSLESVAQYSERPSRISCSVEHVSRRTTDVAS